MSRPDALATLRQIEEIAQKAAKLGESGSRDQLESDWQYQLAAERVIELIGEAATRLPWICASGTKTSRDVKSSE
jgi:uncharacterized protein with HEPN domain